MKLTQHNFFRVTLALYLAIHFLQLIPWGTELFSSSGVIPEASLSPLTMVFPNALAYLDSPAAIQTVLIVAVFFCAMLCAGAHDRWAALALWYVWACLYGRNPLIANPSIPYAGWLLLAHACTGRHPEARKKMFAAAWILMAIGYSYSGYTKLVSRSWMDGSALLHVLESPLARATSLRIWILGADLIWLLRIATWFVLVVELAFAPLSLIRRLRPILWGLLLATHLSLILLLDFADLSAGMILIHVFTWDPAWIKEARPMNAVSVRPCEIAGSSAPIS